MTAATLDADVLVVGAGLGGLYAIHKLRSQGLDVVCLEAAPEVGGVWYHNSYPGARVDLESESFCYLFDEALYRGWQWSERYAAQAEILAYLTHFADQFDLRRSIRFNSRVQSLAWSEPDRHYVSETVDGSVVRTTWVILATGQLSTPTRPDFAGLGDFRGDWFQTSQWPKGVTDLRGKRVAVIGTGSSGVQAITSLAGEVEDLWVLQRTPNYSVPAHNNARSPMRHEFACNGLAGLREVVMSSSMGFLAPPAAGGWHQFDYWEREQLLSQRWAHGGQSLLKIFTDQGTDWEANAGVGDFVRRRIHERLQGRNDLAALIPDAYPIGTRRLCVDTGYYERYLQNNVHLVDLRTRALRRFGHHSVHVDDLGEIDIDAVVFALGFDAFTGALYEMDIRGRDGQQLQQAWSMGPRTLYGVMTHGFPNLFIATGPGSPSVLANMFVANVQHMDFIDAIIADARSRGTAAVEPLSEAQAAWSEHVQDVARGLIRYQVDNYLLHWNTDGSRVYLPYTGGFGSYVGYCDEELAEGLPNFTLGGHQVKKSGERGAWRAA